MANYTPNAQRTSTEWRKNGTTHFDTITCESLMGGKLTTDTYTHPVYMNTS